MRNIPTYLWGPAESLLRAVGGHLLGTDELPPLGQRVDLEDHGPVLFALAEPAPGLEDHYTTDRWELRSVPIRCDCCSV